MSEFKGIKLRFRKQLFDKIVSGQKTATTRPLRKPRSFAYYKSLKKRNNVYAYCSETTEFIWIKVESVTRTYLVDVVRFCYREEGFESPDDFAEYWRKLYGKYNWREEVAFIRFKPLAKLS